MKRALKAESGTPAPIARNPAAGAAWTWTQVEKLIRRLIP